MNKESEYKLLVVSVVVVMVSGLLGIPTMMGLSDLYATKQSKQVPPEKTTVQPERQSQQPSAAAPGATTRQPERQPQFSPEQQEDDNGNDAAIEQKDEQFTDVLQEDDNGNDDDEEQIEQNEIDKKAPIAISDGNIYVVWFNDQNTPNNNSEVLFRSSADGGISFSDKINLSNTTTADSIDAEIAADGSNIVVTWWEHNATSVEPVIRASTDNGVTFGSMLRLATNGTIGEG